MKKSIRKSGITMVMLACVCSAAFAADLVVMPEALSFSAYQDGAYPPPQTLTVYNRTDAAVDWQITDLLPGWLSVSPLSGSLDPNGMPGDAQEVTVSVITDGLASGNYSYSFDFLAGAERQSVTIELAFEPPSISVSSTEFFVSMLQGATEVSSAELIIENAAGKLLEWQVADVNGVSLDLPVWLSISPSGGLLDADQIESIQLVCSAGDLTPGLYHFEFCVTAPAYGITSALVTVSLDICGPNVSFSTDAISVEVLEGAVESIDRQFTITNNGGGVFDYVLVDSGADTFAPPAWLTIAPTTGALAAGQSQTVFVTFNPQSLTAGTYEYHFAAKSNGIEWGGCSVTIKVKGPVLNGSSARISFAATENGDNPAPQVLTLFNSGGGVLNWSFDMTDKPDWLTMSPVCGSLTNGQSDDVAITANITGLAAGSYSWTFPVSAPGAFGSPHDITVSLTVEFALYDWSTNPGTGTVDDPYQVSTPEQLNAIGTNPDLRSSHFVLTSDIDMSACTGTDYAVIDPFYGTFDGNGHVIYNLTYSTTENQSYVGMFGRISGEVRNLVLENVTMASGGDLIGGLAGYNDGGRITNCQVSGSVQGRDKVGGLCGQSIEQSNIARCSAAGNVSGCSYVGGLCGSNTESILMGCSASGNMTATDSYSYAGGLCGGVSNSTITQCFATGDVNGSGGIGGLIGYISSLTVVQECYASGSISGAIAVGGLCGYVDYSYANAIENCYAAGHVSGTSYVAGFIGQGEASFVNGCFWNVQTSGQTDGSPYALPGLTGLETESMQTLSTFTDAGWDFDFMWFMPESDYPKLRWQMGDGADLYPDLDRDGRVDLADYMVLAGYWLAECSSPVDCANADLDRSGVVDLSDLNRVSQRWLAGTEPEGMEWVYIEDPGLSGYLGFTGYMSRYETTNAQYCQFLNEAMAAGKIVVDSGKIKFKRPDGYFGPVYYDLSGPGQTADGAVNGGKARISFAEGLFTVESGFEDHPVTYVAWHGAKAFCSYYGYRLPEDWEWRAASDFDGSYIYGTGLTIDNTLANYEGSVHPGGTTPVGSFGAYGYGLCDMSGNVYEWTDSYNRMYSSFSIRTVVGGGWVAAESPCRISSSTGGSTEPTSLMAPALGFRVCR